MGDDTCSVILRIWHEDSLAVARAFREEPDATESLDDDDSGLLRLLVYEETVPDPLRQLAEQRVAFDGRCSNRFHAPGQLFASLDGEFRAIDHPYGVVTVPTDLETLSVDQEALAALRAYRELADRVGEHFRALTRGSLAEASGQPIPRHTASRLADAAAPSVLLGDPPISDPVAGLNQALGLARRARSLLRRARAPRSHRKAASLCHSIEGAVRHALRLAYRDPHPSRRTPARDQGP
jgi:hypothetical protein